MSDHRRSALMAHWKNPSLIAGVKASIRRGMLAGRSLKEIGGEVDLRPTKVSRWAYSLGFRLSYITEEERAHLLARRQKTLDADFPKVQPSFQG